MVKSEKFQKGFIGGTSAGAMRLYFSLSVSGASDCSPPLNSIEVAPGMNLLKDSIIDTHSFAVRKTRRLLSAVAQSLQILGIGIDALTAMIAQNGKFKVVGDGAVTIVCAKHSAQSNLSNIGPDETIGIFDVDFHALPEGCRYDSGKREPMPETPKKMTEGV